MSFNNWPPSVGIAAADVPELSLASGYFWSTNYGLRQARILAWAHSNSYCEKDWPEDQRKEVHKARAQLLAFKLSMD